MIKEMRISDILKEVQKEQMIYENYGWGNDS